MSEIIVLTDEALRLALLQAEEAEYLHLRPGEAEELPLPPELLRRLRPLLSDPFGDRRRRRRAWAGPPPPWPWPPPSPPGRCWR